MFGRAAQNKALRFRGGPGRESIGVHDSEQQVSCVIRYPAADGFGLSGH